MANKDYYARWLQIKQRLNDALIEDNRLQEIATEFIGVKPQATAIEIVARVYAKYCDLYNKLCDCYDQMEQVQRRPAIKTIIDAITCRLLELKVTLEEVEVFEYTYPDNALKQMLMIPDDIKILCPFFYPFEIRQQEKQYIIDEIFAGHRLGDPEPTPSELERLEEQRLEEERIKREEKEVHIKKLLALGEDIPYSIDEVILSPEEQAKQQAQAEYELHSNTIQRMERSRVIIRQCNRKKNKDKDQYLELAGLKAPKAPIALENLATNLIKLVYRRYMELKRQQLRERKLKEKLGMVLSSYKPPSAHIQLEKVKETRRNFRRKYYENWLKANVKENDRVLRLREGDTMEDISTEIRAWFYEWYKNLNMFDEFPWPDEGGSILVVQGETFTIEEYLKWHEAEEKRIKAEANAPKNKAEIKAEKKAAKEEQKRVATEAKLKEQKRILDYKKSRLNPTNDPGIYLPIGKTLGTLTKVWHSYENEWNAIDVTDPNLDAIRGHIMYLITENAYRDLNLQVRPIVDEMMRLELKLLNVALKNDYKNYENPTVPKSKKRKKPKKAKKPKLEKRSPEEMFQVLVDGGIVRKYPKVSLDDYWGERNYAASDLRAIEWTPSFPPPCIGDVREQVRTRCLLTLGSDCRNAVRTQLLVGSKNSGKKTLVYAIATETNSILIDLSPMNVYNKFPGPKKLKLMFSYVTKISKIMQPTVILIENADKIFLKKVSKEEKIFDPTRLEKDLYKEIVKPISYADKILVLGTAAEPWLAKTPKLKKVFPSLILIPRTDYGSISFILADLLMQYHGVKRDFNVHSIAQTLRGYDINTIKKSTTAVLNGRRIADLYHRPLEPMELLSAILNDDEAILTDDFDYNMFEEWYLTYSPMGTKYMEYMFMLETQMAFKLKEEKKKL